MIEDLRLISCCIRNGKGMTEQEINVLATQQIDERELLISKFESELGTLHRTQFSEFRQVR